MLLSVKYLDLNLWHRQVNKILLSIRKLVGLLALTLIACEDIDKQSSQTPLTATSNVEIYLENTLDEPRGCLDVVGLNLTQILTKVFKLIRAIPIKGA